MANLPVLNGAGATVYLKASGAGSDADPHIPEHVLGAGTNNVGDIDVLTVVGDNADLDSGVGTDDHVVVAWGLPASGGHVIGGTGANPIRIDTVSSTVQLAKIASWFPGADVVASVVGNVAVTATVAGIVSAVGSMNVGNFPAIQPISVSSWFVGAGVVASVAGVARTDTVASTVQPVSLASTYVPVNAVASVIGNAAVTATIAGIPGVTLASLATVQGMAAHDAVATGNPVQMGAVAQSAVPLVAAAGDLVRILADLTGAIVARQTLPELIVNGALKGTGATAAQALMNAAGSGIFNYVTYWQVINPNGSLASDVSLHDGTATLAVGRAEASGGGFAFSYPTPLRGAANATVSILAATASIAFLVNAGGYKGN